MLPRRKPVAHAPEARPRIAGGEIRTNSEAAETVNIVEPSPPAARNASSCP
jgi:hypothetical protein